MCGRTLLCSTTNIWIHWEEFHIFLLLSVCCLSVWKEAWQWSQTLFEILHLQSFLYIQITLCSILQSRVSAPLSSPVPAPCALPTRPASLCRAAFLLPRQDDWNYAAALRCASPTKIILSKLWIVWHKTFSFVLKKLYTSWCGYSRSSWSEQGLCVWWLFEHFQKYNINFWMAFSSQNSEPYI